MATSVPVSGTATYPRGLAMQILMVLVICYSVTHLVFSIRQYNVFTHPVIGDFYRVFEEAGHLRETRVLDPRFVVHPPFYYLLLWPLTTLPFFSVARALYALQLALFPAAVILMVKAISDRASPSIMEYMIAGVLTVNFQPFLETLAMYKVEGIEWFLICLAIYLFRKQRDGWTGVILMIAANLKYLPGVLLAYFMLKREWRVLRGALIALAACMLFLLPFFGIEGLWTFFVKYPLALLFGHAHEGTRPEASVEFQTLQGTINRFFAGSEGMIRHVRTQEYVPVLRAGLAYAIGNLVKIPLVGGYLYYLIRRRWTLQQRQEHWQCYLIGISLTLIMPFIVSQCSRVHYAILLLPAFIVVGLLLYRHRAHFGWAAFLLFGLAYGLTGMLIPGGLLNRLPAHPQWGSDHSLIYLWFSLPFWGYILLGVSLLLCARRLSMDKVLTGEAR